jgi:hypothetical protein
MYKICYSCVDQKVNVNTRLKHFLYSKHDLYEVTLLLLWMVVCFKSGILCYVKLVHFHCYVLNTARFVGVINRVH